VNTPRIDANSIDAHIVDLVGRLVSRVLWRLRKFYYT
jgi:hypothetical protein